MAAAHRTRVPVRDFSFYRQFSAAARHRVYDNSEIQLHNGYVCGAGPGVLDFREEISERKGVDMRGDVCRRPLSALHPAGRIRVRVRRSRDAFEHGVLFHTDAVQAAGYVKIDVQKENIDLLSMTAHKLHGPKGCGLLYIRKGVRIENLICGGAQERNKRAGTENVAGIVGLDAALQLAIDGMDERNAKLEKMRDRLIDGLLKIERSRINGDRVHRLPGNVNMCFEGIEGESLLLRLDLKGVSASSGSACTSGSLDPSHVLLAIGLPHEIAHGSMRLSFSDDNTEEDIDYILEIVPEIVSYLRSMSPLWEKIKKQEAQG